MKLYSFEKIPKREEKGYCLTFGLRFQQLGTNYDYVHSTKSNTSLLPATTIAER